MDNALGLNVLIVFLNVLHIVECAPTVVNALQDALTPPQCDT